MACCVLIAWCDLLGGLPIERIRLLWRSSTDCCGSPAPIQGSHFHVTRPKQPRASAQLHPLWRAIFQGLATQNQVLLLAVAPLWNVLSTGPRSRNPKSRTT